MKKSLPIATWYVSIYVECPYCRDNVDLCDHETFWGDHPDLKLASREEIEVTCPSCDGMFNTQLEW